MGTITANHADFFSGGLTTVTCGTSLFATRRDTAEGVNVSSLLLSIQVSETCGVLAGVFERSSALFAFISISSLLCTRISYPVLDDSWGVRDFTVRSWLV